MKKPAAGAGRILIFYSNTPLETQTSSPSGARRNQEGPFPPQPLAPSRSGHPKHKTLVKPVFCCQLTHYQFLFLLLE